MGALQVISQRLPLLSALHELIAAVELVEPDVALPTRLELETDEELVSLVDTSDSMELVTLVELRRSLVLVAPAA